MSIVLGANQYGKAENRVVRIYRDTDRHEIRDLNVSTALRGDFEDAHVAGDQAKVLPTDTQKNTVVRLRQGARGHLARRTTRSPSACTSSTPPRRRPAPGSGCRSTPGTGSRSTARATTTRSCAAARETRTCVVTVDGRGERPAGLGRLRVHRPRRAQVDRLGVQGLPQGQVHDPAGDRRPHHGHLADRSLALRGHRGRRDTDFDAAYEDIKAIMLSAFATTYSRALQETLYAMGKAVLEAHPEVAEVKFAAPNKHHFLVDLAPFGLENDGEVFIAADRPYGLIEASRLPRRLLRRRPGLAGRARLRLIHRQIRLTATRGRRLLPARHPHRVSANRTIGANE